MFASQAPDLSQRIACVIGEYDRQGGHRTGSDVDTKSARWLAGAVRRCGLNPSLEAFIINRVDPKSCYLLVGGRRIEGLPIFDGGFTDAVGARGKFGQRFTSAPISARLRNRATDCRRQLMSLSRLQSRR
jgi:hypothetical protein